MIPRHIALRRAFVFAALLAIIVGGISYNAGVKPGEQKILTQNSIALAASNSAVPAESLQTIPSAGLCLCRRAGNNLEIDGKRRT